MTLEEFMARGTEQAPQRMSLEEFMGGAAPQDHFAEADRLRNEGYDPALASKHWGNPDAPRKLTPVQQLDEQAQLAAQQGELPADLQDVLGDVKYGMRLSDAQQLAKQQHKAMLLQGTGREKWNDFDWEEYRKSLPVPIDSYDMMDQADYGRLKHVNELITGIPFADAEDRPKRQKEIDAERQEMHKAGFDNALDWLIDKQTKEGHQYLPARMGSEFWQGAKTGTHNATTGAVKALADIAYGEGNELSTTLGGQADDIKRARQEQWRQAVEAAKDKNSSMGEGFSSTMRQVGNTTGRMAPAQAAGLVGGPAATFTLMGLDVGADTYNNLRSQGWSRGDALPYALATMTIELGTELLGAKAAKVLGIINPETAFTRGAYQTFQKIIEKGPLKTAFSVLGSMAEEGLEEVAGDILHDFKDRVARQLATENVPDNPVTKESLANTFTVAALSALPGHLPAAAVYLGNLKKSDAKVLGITAPQLEEIKANAQAAQAPTTPQDATAENVTPQSPQHITPQPEANGEVSAPAVEAQQPSDVHQTEQTLPSLPGATGEQQRATVAPDVAPPLLPESPLPVAPPGTPSATVSPAAPEGPGVAQDIAAKSQNNPNPVDIVPEPPRKRRLGDRIQPADTELSRIQSLVTDALPEARGVVSRHPEGGYRISFGHGDVRLELADALNYSDADLSHGLASHGIPDTPENRETLRSGILGSYQLTTPDGTAYDSLGLIRMRREMGRNPSDVLRHELIHMAVQTGLFTHDELAKLAGKYRKPNLDVTNPQQVEEFAAGTTEVWGGKQGLWPRIERHIDKLLELIGVRPKDAARIEQELFTGKRLAKKRLGDRITPTEPTTHKRRLGDKIVKEPPPVRISALSEVNHESIPTGLKVQVEAVRAKTGERVKVNREARQALADIDDSIDTYKRLMECLGS